MTETLILQELQSLRRDIAGITQRLDRIEAVLVDVVGLVETKVLERVECVTPMENGYRHCQLRLLA
jgi:hypothetical protein